MKIPRNLKFQLGYFICNFIILITIYESPISILYLRSLDGAKDKVIESFLWLSVLASWFFYLILNGSNPGYIVKKYDEEEASSIDTLNGQEKLSEDADAVETESSEISSANFSDEIEIELTSISGTRKPGLHQRTTPTSSDTSIHDNDESHSELSHVANSREDVRFAGGEDKDDLFVEHGSLLGTDSVDYNPDLTGSIADAIVDASRGFRKCKWCDMQQLSRAHHCRECNACVATFDHHCTMINTCIGENNRARFLSFILAQMVAIAVAIGILNSAFVYRRTMSDWASDNVWTLICVILLWVAQVPLVILCIFHMYLAAANLTTFEVLNGSAKLWYFAGTGYEDHRDCDLPFSTGLFRNLRMFCCVLDQWDCIFRLTSCRNRRTSRKRNRRSGHNSATAPRESSIEENSWDKDMPPPRGAFIRPQNNPKWTPYAWPVVRAGDRDSEDVINNVWENRYWRCC